MSNCLVCNCNRTMPLDGAALSQALAIEAPIRIHRELCRAEIGVFESALAAADANVEGLTIACTQEAPLFDQLAEASAHREVPLSFVNIRESGGWSAEAGKSTPKIAALISMDYNAEVVFKATARLRNNTLCKFNGSWLLILIAIS